MVNDELQKFITKANKLLMEALNADDYQEAQRIGIISIKKLKAQSHDKASAQVADEVRFVINNYMDNYSKTKYAPPSFDKAAYSFDARAQVYQLSQMQLSMYNYLDSAYTKDFITKYQLVNTLLSDGVLTRKQAVGQVLKSYNGPTVQFKNGTNYPAKAYFKTVLQDNQNAIARDTGRNLGAQLGTKVYIYTSGTTAKNPRDVCLSLGNKPVAFEDVQGIYDAYGNAYDVINLYTHGYGTPSGPLGIGCGHDIYPIVNRAFII